MEPPLIVTLMLDEHSAAYFNVLRKAHFPPERNFLNAHLTLFHHLPSGEGILQDVERICRAQEDLELNVSDVVFIGAGVAFKVQSPALARWHKELQHLWDRWLIPQDRQKLWPHITVQNKVPPDQARHLQQQLAASFEAFPMQGLGLSVWEYLGGPWKLVGQYSFLGNKENMKDEE